MILTSKTRWEKGKPWSSPHGHRYASRHGSTPCRIPCTAEPKAALAAAAIPGTSPSTPSSSPAGSEACGRCWNLGPRATLRERTGSEVKSFRRFLLLGCCSGLSEPERARVTKIEAGTESEYRSKQKGVVRRRMGGTGYCEGSVTCLEARRIVRADGPVVFHAAESLTPP